MLSKNIKTQTDMLNQQKEIDKLLLGAVRTAAMHDQELKVMEYVKAMNFTKTMRVAVKLCEELNAKELAFKVNAYIS